LPRNRIAEIPLPAVAHLRDVVGQYFVVVDTVTNDSVRFYERRRGPIRTKAASGSQAKELANCGAWCRLDSGDDISNSKTAAIWPICLKHFDCLNFNNRFDNFSFDY